MGGGSVEKIGADGKVRKAAWRVQSGRVLLLAREFAGDLLPGLATALSVLTRPGPLAKPTLASCQISRNRTWVGSRPAHHSSTKGSGGCVWSAPFNCVVQEMRKARLAIITSRKNASNARKSETIAATNKTVMTLDK